MIRYLVRALFDPGSGGDAFTQTDLADTARRMRSRQEPPSVADPRLEELLAGVTGDAGTFEEVMGGAVNRLEKASIDRRVATLFEHMADESGLDFDLRELLDEDVVVVVETGGLRARAQHAVLTATDQSSPGGTERGEALREAG